MRTEKNKPVFKWPGGKFKLAPAIAEALAERSAEPQAPAPRRLVEPFAGSGAVFLNTDYPECLLCDANADIISFYKELSSDPENFIEECRALFAGGNDKEVYARRRDRFNALPGKGGTDKEIREKAALFLYLNRFGYNGLVRYNAKGIFNVPFGRYKNPYFPEPEMRAFAEKATSRTVQFRAADFRETLRSAGEGDAVYCDPPYFPLSPTANFTAYSAAVFGIAEQEDLAQLVAEASKRGARCVVSNHDLPAVRRLYAGARQFIPLKVRRTISCNPNKRSEAPELLIVY